ncbi:MAG: transposase [Halobacteria archaeon]|nr:transposase [Halobacteria archaeon]
MTLLTNLSKTAAPAQQIAELYRKRWTIETAFQELEVHLHSEINSLGYPKAALFGFCVALVAYNVLALVKARCVVYTVKKR